MHLRQIKHHPREEPQSSDHIHREEKCKGPGKTEVISTENTPPNVIEFFHGAKARIDIPTWLPPPPPPRPLNSHVRRWD